MKTVNVELGERSYEIRIGSGLLSQTGQWLKDLGFSGKLVIITDPRVKELHGDRLISLLSDEGFNVISLEVPQGEEQKSLESAGRLYYELTNLFAERSTPILALGGGVIGDLAGFVAVTYMRGVPFIQVPTTLLAQVDASIGGKVAVNHGQLKNNIGTFYQPRLVISDIDVLRTLPSEELLNGLSEVIKSAAIRSEPFFTYLESNLRGVESLTSAMLEEMIFQCARIKADIVEKDERDLGLRNILNYGHTLGHAVEAASNFSIKHGLAVAIGMVFAARIANQMEILSTAEMLRLRNLIREAGLPTQMPKLKVDEVAAALRHDKKVVSEKMRFVLLESIGKAFVLESVSPDLVQQIVTG